MITGARLIRDRHYLGVGERGEEREECRLLDCVLLVLGGAVSHFQQVLSHSSQHLEQDKMIQALTCVLLL